MTEGLETLKSLIDEMLATVNMDEIRYSRNDLKKILENIWDNTFEKEVGLRLFLQQIAEAEGFKLDRRLKKYGESSRANKSI